MRVRRVGVLLSLLLTLLPPAPAQAATITVNSTADDFDMTPDGDCTLREAIRAANDDAAFGGCPAGSGVDTIVVPAGEYNLFELGFDDTTAAGDLDILSSLRIEGAGAGAAIIDASTVSDRVLDVPSGAGTVTVDIVGVTIRDGNPGPSLGGGIRISSSQATVNLVNSSLRDNKAVVGGGIHNGASTLNLIDTTLDGNESTSLGGGIYQGAASQVNLTRVLMSGNKADDSGGGLYNESDQPPGGATISDSAFIGNIANDDATGGGDGGGVSSQSSPLTVTGTTFTGNRAEDGDGLDVLSGTATLRNVTISSNGSIATGGQGGGLRVDAGATSTLENVTMDANAATATGGNGGNLYNAGTVGLQNTLIGVHFGGSNCGGAGTITDSGNNIEETAGGGASCVGTIVQDAGLQTLADNGGPPLAGGLEPAYTHALQPGSPAIDAGAGCLSTDQRGVPRPQGSGCDIGAYEQAFCQGVLVNRVGVASGEGVVYGTDGPDGILGLGGDEDIFGQEGDDKVCAGDGNDTVVGRDNPVPDDGKDSVLGEGGNDTLRGGTNDDQLTGGPGDDQLFGDDGADSLFGEDGKDQLLGGPGTDTLDGDSGNDTLNGGADDDKLTSGAGNDLLLGEEGNETAAGGGGNDKLKGGSGKDKLKGQAGNDRLNGGKQRDRCSGGAGKKDRASKSCEKVTGVP